MAKNYQFLLLFYLLLIGGIPSFYGQLSHNSHNPFLFPRLSHPTVTVSPNDTRTVTLYNPNQWPGPDDSALLTTPSTRTTNATNKSVVIEVANDISSNFGYGQQQEFGSRIPPASFASSTFDQPTFTHSPHSTATRPTFRPSFRPTTTYTRTETAGRTQTTCLPVVNTISDIQPFHGFGGSTSAEFGKRIGITRDPHSSGRFPNPIAEPVPESALRVPRVLPIPIPTTSYFQSSSYHHQQPPANSFPSFSLSQVPRSSFSCRSQPVYGYFADVEANCQLFHICSPTGTHAMLFCPDFTLFNQKTLTCDWNRNVDCQQSNAYYESSNSEKLYAWNQLHNKNSFLQPAQSDSRPV